MLCLKLGVMISLISGWLEKRRLPMPSEVDSSDCSIEEKKPVDDFSLLMNQVRAIEFELQMVRECLFNLEAKLKAIQLSSSEDKVFSPGVEDLSLPTPP